MFPQKSTDGKGEAMPCPVKCFVKCENYFSGVYPVKFMIVTAKRI